MKTIVTVLALTASIDAGTIVGVAHLALPNNSTGSLGPVGATPAPNNDDAAGLSANVVNQTVFLNTVGVIEAGFRVAPSNGVTEYRFSPVLFNIGGPRIARMRFELGFGRGASFTPSALNDGLDFDFPDQNPAGASPVFPVVTAGEDWVEFSGAAAPLFAPTPFVLSIDVSDGIDSFTIRATPAAVPEPATWALGACGAFLLWLRRATQTPLIIRRRAWKRYTR